MSRARKNSSLAQTLHWLKRAAAHGDSVAVGLSGGKDSLATLDLCHQAFPEVVPFFMYLVKGLRCETGPVEAAAKRYGLEVLHVPHWNLSRYYKSGLWSPRNRGLNIRNLGPADVERHLRDKLGVKWVAYGHRMDDSIRRRFHLEKRGCIDWQTMRLAPLWDWTQTTVLRYLKARNIRLPARNRFGQAKRGSGRRKSQGLDLADPDCLRWLSEHHPADWARVLEVFPAAEVALSQPTGGDE